jgi:hypothetical protein
MVSQLAETWRRLVPVFCAVATVIILGGLSTLTGCRPGVPVIDPGSRPAQSHGTISGTVRGSASQAAIEGRTVEAIQVDTGERQREVTSSTGGFTFKLKPGKYRVELTLRSGESLTKRPGIIDLNKIDLDTDADFILGVPHNAGPSDPAKLSGSLLGPPIA